MSATCWLCARRFWVQVWNVQSAGARGAIVINFEVRPWRCNRLTDRLTEITEAGPGLALQQGALG